MLPVAPIELAELLLGAGQADLETFDLAESAFRLGFGDSGDQAVADLGKPCPLGRVRSEERASDTSVPELMTLKPESGSRQHDLMGRSGGVSNRRYGCVRWGDGGGA